MSNFNLFAIAIITFAVQLFTCFKAKNRILRHIGLLSVLIPAFNALLLFFNSGFQYGWDRFAALIYLFMAAVWLTAYGLAWLVYFIIKKLK